MYRTLDINPLTNAQSSTLPPIDWTTIQQSAPVPIAIGARRPGDPLPVADIVILTWTLAEWSALDHVFLGSQAERQSTDYSWKSTWHAYSRGAGEYIADPQSGALWGLFQLVRITDRSGRPWRVLLFKSNSHLAHAPWIEGLSAMLQCVLADAKPDRIYSIGTAGGARPSQRLGDSVITNCALLDVQRPTNTLGDDNGSLFRCQTWFPTTSLLEDIEHSLLYPMNRIVTDAALTEMFGELQAKHAGDSALNGISLVDLANEPVQPSALGTPRVLAMKDVPLLTTDYYYIAGEGGADAHSFLEMDDAVIAREAALKGVRYAFIRNISDPIVGARTAGGQVIPDGVRSDWSGLIYNRYGLQTSFNGAVATWATIAGEGEAAYNPPRSKGAFAADDPIEVKLAYQVRSCGTCSFFWPEKKTDQPYGPYTAYDFQGSTPFAAPFKSTTNAAPWLLGRSHPPVFPEAEVIDGCRKAPIMTIGINPNLTAFAPGQTGAAWCYPSFTSDNATDAWTKYAWYYRYRSVYQERIDFDFARNFILPEGRVLATSDGYITAANRPDDSPVWTIAVRYDGDAADTAIALPGVKGDFPYVTLFDSGPPHNRFKAGDVLAGRMSVPGGIRLEIQQQQQGYYMQFVPVLEQFQDTLRKAGHDANLRIGEDVSQIDLVACASPHWNPEFLGGTPESVKQIVDNCVSLNTWAMKQIIQSRPAVLYIVSQSSWKMFNDAFGAFICRKTPISPIPVDTDFTLLRETTNPDNPCTFEVHTTIDGRPYDCVTRIVITPHFSYNDNFQPQFRMSPAEWLLFTQQQPACVAAMTAANGFQVVPPDPLHPSYYMCIRLPADPVQAAKATAFLEGQFPEAYKTLAPTFVDPHAMMASVLDEMLASGKLAWQQDDPTQPGYLARTGGSCQFCVNQHWQLPLGCAYGKNKEAPPPVGFLEQVARYVVGNEKTPGSVPTTQMRPTPPPIGAAAAPMPLDPSEATAGPGSPHAEIPAGKDTE
jgi:nucleoside phosphorylase